MNNEATPKIAILNNSSFLASLLSYRSVCVIDDVMSKGQSRPLVLLPVSRRNIELGRFHGPDYLLTPQPGVTGHEFMILRIHMAT